MELRHLRYFQVVSQLSSITKAAAQLNISQPSLTVTIQNLEEELGVPLFERNYRSIRLTVEGTMFLKHVDDILLRLNDSLQELNDYKLKRAASIKIGIPPMIGVFLFSYIFHTFRTLYPEFELTIVERGSLSVKRLLEKGKLDVGFMIIGDKLTSIEVLPVVQTEILVCLSTNHPLGQLEKIPVSALADQPLILLKEDAYIRKMIMEECKKNQFSPNVIFSTRQVQTIINLVEQGIGVSFLTDVVAKKQKNITSRSLVDPLLIQAGLGWRRDRYMSKALTTFIEFIKGSFVVK